MVELIKFDFSDDHFKEWNNFVEQHHRGSIFHLAEWALIYQQCYGYEPHFYFVKNGSKTSGILNLFHCKGFYKNIITSLSIPLLYDNRIIAEKFIASFKPILDKLKPNKFTFLFHDEVKCEYYKNTDNVTVSIDLGTDSNELFARIGPKKRNMIRKGQKSNLKFRIIENIDHEVIKVFYNIYSKNYRDLGTPVNSRRYFELQVQFLKKNVKLLVVDLENQPIGVMWLHSFKNTLSDPEAAALKKYNFTGVNDFMYWSAFEYGIGTGCKYFDMGRSQIDSGTYHFKKNFLSSTISVLTEYSTSASSILQKKKRYSQIITLWKKLPVEVTNLFGPSIRKHFDI